MSIHGPFGVSPNQYPDDHPGWGRLIDGMVQRATKVEPPPPIPPPHEVRRDLSEMADIIGELGLTRIPAMRAVRDRLSDFARAV